jgi:hypothetical protein
MARVAFVVRKRIAEVPVQSFNTPRGTLLVSTPEATALDLVGYHESHLYLPQIFDFGCATLTASSCRSWKGALLWLFQVSRDSG